MGDEPGRVLVVDDDRLTRMVIAGGVRKEGHEVTLAADGEEALALLRAQAHDLVLLDILMPGMDGFAVLAEIRADPALHATPVIVVSGLEDMASTVRAIELGAVDYLPKPIEDVLLRARLRTTLEQKRLRDLERAYLRQEVALRQNEKLATLGRLSAGLTHELNNPAAAAARSAGLLGDGLERLVRGAGTLLAAGLGLEDVAWIAAQFGAAGPGESALARADREDELAEWLDRAGGAEPAELASALAECGADLDAVLRCAQRYPERRLVAALAWIGHAAAARALLGEIRRALDRIVEIVEALKGYTYLDRGPEQLVDVHAGLDDTLLVLAARLAGVQVHRRYAPDVPPVPGRGSELNQVWTALVANAADALGGQGALEVRTEVRNGEVRVDVTDDGPGVAPAVLDRVFDPFVTTKPPGAGLGLGLTTAHQIVTAQHGGRIAAASRPGATAFTVWLPVTRRPTAEGSGAGPA